MQGCRDDGRLARRGRRDRARRGRAHVRLRATARGRRLLRADDGRIAGSVSGGCVEGAAAEEIERARKDGNSRVIRYGISDEEAWTWASPVAGRSTCSWSRRSTTPRSPAPMPRTRGRDDPPGGRAAAGVRAPRARRRVAAATASWSARTGRWTGPLAARRTTTRFEPPPRTRCCAGPRGRSRRRSPGLRRGVPGQATAGDRGCGRGRAVARGVREELGYTVVVVDGRASFATPERFPADRVDRLVVGWPDEVADEIGLGRDDAVAVLTHDVKFDEPAIVEALRVAAGTSGRSGRRRRRATAASGCARPA